MKGYKVLTVKDPEDAESMMNKWRVKAVTHWETAMAYRLIITFERDV